MKFDAFVIVVAHLCVAAVCWPAVLWCLMFDLNVCFSSIVFVVVVASGGGGDVCGGCALHAL